jgi:hypothetical protein
MKHSRTSKPVRYGSLVDICYQSIWTLPRILSFNREPPRLGILHSEFS